MNYLDTYHLWAEKVEDEDLKKELEEIKNDNKTIENKFFKDLAFGTGGLRGELGVGSNCLNIYTIRKATQGLSSYIKKIKGKKVVISYDSRINSTLFAKHSACVLCENGLEVYLVKELMPTPFLSFATRYYHADAGIMITASHNPSRYNGYKVYSSDGCQILDECAEKIIEEIEKVDCFSVYSKDFDYYFEKGKIKYIDDEVEDIFLEEIFKKSIETPENIKVTYTPLNGTGYRIIPKMLKKHGIDNVDIVKEQGYPDGNFPTCPYPNPEKKQAMELALSYARKNNSDIALATDPDGDRVGVAVKNGNDYTLMSGNEIGVLLMDYIISEKIKNNSLPKNPIVVKTIVTTSLGEKIADKYGIEIVNVLTGFKYIGNKITKLEEKGQENRFLLGFEESYGYLAGSYVRDKDAVIACMLIVEMASHYKKQGLTLKDKMNQLYSEFGTYSHKLLNFEFKGALGARKMSSILKDLRVNLPVSLGEKKVVSTLDYLYQTKLDLPKANVLQFDLEDNCQVIIRPSGTEPQIKIYITSAMTEEKNQIFIEKVENNINEMFS